MQSQSWLEKYKLYKSQSVMRTVSFHIPRFGKIVNIKNTFMPRGGKEQSHLSFRSSRTFCRQRKIERVSVSVCRTEIAVLLSAPMEKLVVWERSHMKHE